MSPFNGTKNSDANQKSNDDDEKKEEDESNDGTGDPETAASYVFHLLPLFIKTHQTSMVASVKKATLGLIRRMVCYSSEEHLKQLTKSPGFASGLVEVLATVLENEVMSCLCVLHVYVLWCCLYVSMEMDVCLILF